ncbi:UNVERIFIED_CONTAM: hypothetical protein K2H54_023861 [Gekko kuhli]
MPEAGQGMQQASPKHPASAAAGSEELPAGVSRRDERGQLHSSKVMAAGFSYLVGLNAKKELHQKGSWDFHDTLHYANAEISGDGVLILSGCPRAKKSGIRIVQSKEDKEDQEPIRGYQVYDGKRVTSVSSVCYPDVQFLVVMARAI